MKSNMGIARPKYADKLDQGIKNRADLDTDKKASMTPACLHYKVEEINSEPKLSNAIKFHENHFSQCWPFSASYFNNTWGRSTFKFRPAIIKFIPKSSTPKLCLRSRREKERIYIRLKFALKKEISSNG